MRPFLVLLLLLAMAFAGCADSPDDDSSDGSDDGGTNTGANAGETGNGGGDGDDTPSPIVFEEVDVPFYLGPDGLALTAPADDMLPLIGAASMFGVGNIADAEFATQAFGIPMRIPAQAVTTTVWLETEAIGVGNPAFDLAVWVGTSKGELAFGFASNVVLEPAALQETTIDLNVAHDMVLPAGETITMRILGMYQPDGGNLHSIVVGAETPTGFELTLQPLDAVIPSEGSEQLLSESGQLQGGSFAECDAGETIHRFIVPEEATVIDIMLSAGNIIPGAHADVDLDLYDGNTIIWHAGSPYTNEQIFVAGPALEDYRGKELGVGASICLGPAADYTITVSSDVAAAA